jgi:hypothetical protein
MEMSPVRHFSFQEENEDNGEEDEGMPRPCEIVRDVVVVQGGFMGTMRGDKPKIVALQLVALPLAGDSVRFWEVKTNSDEACRLLTGRPRCQNPLAKMDIFKTWRKAICLARAATDASTTTEEAAREELEGMGGASDDDEGCQSKIGPRGGKRAKKRHVMAQTTVTLNMPVSPKLKDGDKISILALNQIKTVGMEFNLRNLNWLLNYIAEEQQASRPKV